MTTVINPAAEHPSPHDGYTEVQAGSKEESTGTDEVSPEQEIPPIVIKMNGLVGDKIEEKVEADVAPRKGVKKPNWQGAIIEDKSVWLKWKCGNSKYSPQIRCNPVVTICAIVCVSAFILWCILDTKEASKIFKTAKTAVSSNFSWLYIGSQDIKALVIIAIYFSKYGAMKLGKDNDEPEYPDGSWFAMLFACGVGVGLFFYGVGEPIFHYTQPNRYSADGQMPDNLVAQNAMNITFFHWGIHSWIVYTIVGLLLAFMAFRKGLPMTMKSCFYPLIGDRIYGWMGDVIDILSIITTLFGVCTSLGLGTMQVNAGLNYIFPSIEKETGTQVVIIWVITGIATLSVVSGVGVGVRRLSETCFGLGMFIMMTVFFLDNAWYLLNLYTQSFGYYIQYMVQLGFHTDAFELLNVASSEGADRGRNHTDGSMDGPSTWMDDWTIFYWGWWNSWCPFVGMFIAKISKGRTIRQFINGTLTAPMIYTFLWLTIFGGSGLRNEKVAAFHHNDTVPFCCPAAPGKLHWNEAAALASSGGDWKKELTKNVPKHNFNDIKKCSDLMIQKWESEWKAKDAKYDKTLSEFVNFGNFYNVTKNRYKMSISEDRSIARLSCIDIDDMWFTLMFTYGKMGTFLSIVSLGGIILYFVTSSDSGSLVIDILAANGDQDPPVIQKVFWACLEGAAATALLVAGGKEALGALQTASIVTGLPYSIIICFLCVSLWRGLAMEHGDLNPYGADFKIGIVDPFTIWSPSLWFSFLKNIFMTPMVIYSTALKMGSGKTGAMFQCIAGFSFWVLWILLLGFNQLVPGLYALAWVCYISFATLIAKCRADVRDTLDINGNPFEDFFACLILYPSVAIQLDCALEKGGLTTLMPDTTRRSSNIKNSNSTV